MSVPTLTTPTDVNNLISPPASNVTTLVTTTLQLSEEGGFQSTPVAVVTPLPTASDYYLPTEENFVSAGDEHPPPQFDLPCPAYSSVRPLDLLALSEILKINAYGDAMQRNVAELDEPMWTFLSDFSMTQLSEVYSDEQLIKRFQTFQRCNNARFRIQMMLHRLQKRRRFLQTTLVTARADLQNLLNKTVDEL